MAGTSDRPRHFLFVCGRNRWRSPTAEAIFAGRGGLLTMSAGLSPDAEVPIDADLVSWADRIFVMERSQLRKLKRQFGALLAERRVVSLDIPDRYRFMEPALVDQLERKMRPFLR
ncbi:low molecular weight protein tyrosine phosphatase family protein [Croceicoccus mobilis]|uniref:Protein-tyrosine-phosphatase n=1 Tax=Croceicoccus mobilis TaxID=1703339 RepID=A0A916Z777_9SPHN|nr:phosphotyrosine protein phosphatase [Croceicoccus mobilis]GGD77772.1 hypothetical protein GCM10010990_29400 [Croceicoccus mobilis]